MSKPSTILKVATLTSSLLLVGAFVAYQAGAYEWIQLRYGDADAAVPPATEQQKVFISGSKSKVFISGSKSIQGNWVTPMSASPSTPAATSTTNPPAAPQSPPQTPPPQKGADK